MMAVLMPITSAADDTSGPPELPGLSAASVWITSSMVRPLTERIERPSAETTPAVTVELETQGIADRDHQLPAAQAFGIAERGIAQIPRAVGAQQRQIGVGIDAEHAGVGDDALIVPEPDLFGRADHMAIGQHQSVRRDNDSRTQAAALARMRQSGAGFDPDDGGPDALGNVDDGIGVGVEQALRRSRERARRFATARRRQMESRVKSNMARFLRVSNGDGILARQGDRRPRRAGVGRSGNVHHTLSGATRGYQLVAAVLFDWNHESRLAPILSKIKLKIRAKRLRECFDDPQSGSRPDISR